VFFPFRVSFFSEPLTVFRGRIKERGKDYNHSTFCDLVISGLVGIRPRHDNKLVLNPLLPDGTWDWFCLDRVPYHGHELTVIWDRDGKRYNRGAGFQILIDGNPTARSDKLSKLEAALPPRAEVSGLSPNAD
jgi:hypothetical protein